MYDARTHQVTTANINWYITLGFESPKWLVAWVWLKLQSWCCAMSKQSCLPASSCFIQFYSSQLQTADWSLATTVHCKNPSCGWVGTKPWCSGELSFPYGWWYQTLFEQWNRHHRHSVCFKAVGPLHAYIMISNHYLLAPPKLTLRGYLGSKMALWNEIHNEHHSLAIKLCPMKTFWFQDLVISFQGWIPR